jgi:predicted transcriptional regulator
MTQKERTKAIEIICYSVNLNQKKFNEKINDLRKEVMNLEKQRNKEKTDLINSLCQEYKIKTSTINIILECQ